MEKFFIKNKHGEKISVTLDISKNSKRLVFVMHGLGGFKEQDHIKTFADAFKENKFYVVRFDARNTLGESEGNYENANITNYYEDLEVVIDWAKKQEWYREPFYLVGHSLGSICILLYAEKYPHKVKGIAPVSAVISGELLIKRQPEDELKKWNKTGWKINPSKSKPGIMKKLRWHQFVEDIKKYDIIPKLSKLTMPVLLITGEKDEGTPPKDHKMLYNKLQSDKELHIIEGAGHNFREQQELKEIKEIFIKWIKRIEIL